MLARRSLQDSRGGFRRWVGTDIKGTLLFVLVALYLGSLLWCWSVFPHNHGGRGMAGDGNAAAAVPGVSYPDSVVLKLEEVNNQGQRTHKETERQALLDHRDQVEKPQNRKQQQQQQPQQRDHDGAVPVEDRLVEKLPDKGLKQPLEQTDKELLEKLKEAKQQPLKGTRRDRDRAAVIAVPYAYKELEQPHNQRWLNPDAPTTGFHVVSKPVHEQLCYDEQGGTSKGASDSSDAASIRHCMPNFVIVGTGHAGSTSLYNTLVQHPQVLPAAMKEVQWFAGRKEGWLNVEKYAEKFPDTQDEYHVTGEASTHYFADPAVPSQMRCLVPNARIVILLREPGAHCWSAAGYKLKKIGWDEQEKMWDTCGGKLWKDGEKNRHQDNYHPCHQPDHYIESLKRWYAHFAPEQILVLFSEELRLDMPAALRKVEDHLSLAPFDFGPILDAEQAHKAHAGASGGMPRSFRTLFDHCFKATAVAVRDMFPQRNLTALGDWADVLSGSASYSALPQDGQEEEKWVAIVHYLWSMPMGDLASLATLETKLDNKICYCKQKGKRCSVHLVTANYFGEEGLGKMLPVPWQEEPLLMTEELRSRSPHYGKLLAVGRVLMDVGESTSWAYYHDVFDTMIVDYSISINELLPESMGDEYGLAVSDAPIMGPCAGAYAIKNNAVGREILREWWDMAKHKPPHADQGALYNVILRRTNGSTFLPGNDDAVGKYEDECLQDPRYRPIWGKQTGCFNEYMQKQGLGFGHRAAKGVYFFDARGPDMQAFPYEGYGNRAEKGYTDVFYSPFNYSDRWASVFQPGDFLLHGGNLKASAPSAIAKQDRKERCEKGPAAAFFEDCTHKEEFGACRTFLTWKEGGRAEP